MSIDSRTRLIGLLGHPVEHSLSPLIHNTALDVQHLNFRYVAFDVEPERLIAAVQGMIALGFLGSNVTIPHKQAVLDLVDELSEQARAVGAANTLVFRDNGTVYADNTDVAGFLAPLLPFTSDLAGTEMVVLGAGGSARAVVYALLTSFRPARLTILARSREKGEQVAGVLSSYDANGALQVSTFDDARDSVTASSLVVNTTPVGMYPDVDRTPWPGGFSRRQFVYDLIYNPGQTRLLQEAAGAGARVISGLEMLVGQAAASYIQWTGLHMPLDAVYAALARRFSKA